MAPIAGAATNSCYMNTSFFFPEVLWVLSAAGQKSQHMASWLKEMRKPHSILITTIEKIQLKPATVMSPIAMHTLKERNTK